MLIVFSSKTGNVRRFVGKLPFEATEIYPDYKVNCDCVLISYTTKFGEIPKEVICFMNDNRQYVKAVSVSGNKVWGGNFAIAADKIKLKYNIPIISKFELSGYDSDVDYFIQEVNNIARNV